MIQSIFCCKGRNKSPPSDKVLSEHNSQKNPGDDQTLSKQNCEQRASSENQKMSNLPSSPKLSGCINKCKNLNKSELIPFPCKSCSMCKVCLFNTIEKNIKLKNSMMFQCACELTLPVSLLKNYGLEESIFKYLENLTRIKNFSSKTFICGGCELKNNVQQGNLFCSCERCNKLNCLKCLQSHNESITCKEHFWIEFIRCTACKKERAFDFECKCLICKRCQLGFVKEQLESNALENPICLGCKVALTSFDQQQLFGRKEELVKFKEDSLIAPRFECLICQNNVIVDRGVTLNCLHRFCMPCISTYSTQSLYSLSINSTIIACPKCYKEIGYHILNSLLQGQALDFYHQKLIKNSNNKTSEYLKFCNNCSYGEYISMDTEIFNCPQCSKSMCAKCNKIKSKSCCSSMLKSSLNFYGISIVQCPSCNVKISKDEGCNFIKCTNPECVQVRFCIICFKILKVIKI